jgi:hypothetical protein
MHRYKMSAMQAALDELDNATFNLIMDLQLEDVIAIKRPDTNRELASPKIPTVIRMFAEELVQWQEDRRSTGKESSPTKQDAKITSVQQEEFECLVCGDPVLAEEAWTAPCSHHYCIACLENFHRASLADQTLYPPKCCHLDRCTCRHEFCYVCLAVWKTCRCVRWNGRRLLAHNGDNHRAAVGGHRPMVP